MTKTGGTTPIATSDQKLQRRSFGVSEDLLADEMILRRRLIQMQAEASPVLSATLILVPVRSQRGVSREDEEGRRKRARAGPSALSTHRYRTRLGNGSRRYPTIRWSSRDSLDTPRRPKRRGRQLLRSLSASEEGRR